MSNNNVRKIFYSYLYDKGKGAFRGLYFTLIHEYKIDKGKVKEICNVFL